MYRDSENSGSWKPCSVLARINRAYIVEWSDSKERGEINRLFSAQPYSGLLSQRYDYVIQALSDAIGRKREGFHLANRARSEGTQAC